MSAGPTNPPAESLSGRTLGPGDASGGAGVPPSGAGQPPADSGDLPITGTGDYIQAPCPNCQKPVRIDRRRLKPGRFRLRCGFCKGPIGLIVGEGSDIRIGRLAERSSTSGDQDELPPEIAATLGMNKPPSRSQPARRTQSRSMHDSAVTLSPGESVGGMSGSYTAIPSDTVSAISPGSSVSGVTAAPSGSVHGYVQPPSQVGQGLPPPDVSPGDKLNGYELRKKLGEGGMGAVYLARQMSLDRNVALKVLSPKLSGHPALVSRFMREAYAAGQLVHHNVVQIYDFGKDRPRRSEKQPQAGEEPAGPREIHFFSMEFVDGSSLQNLVRDRGRLEPREAVSLVLQAARGLAFAHEHGIIHRDIKPDNLMLNRQGILKVADLGLVKQLGTLDITVPPAALAGLETAPPPESGSLSAAAAAEITQVSQMMGTPAYMPPEQAVDAKSADARADIYSLGCTLYHLVVGHPPFGGKTLQEVLEAHRTEKVRFPDPVDGGPKISSHLKEVIRRMCGKDPKERFSSMQRVIRELEGYLEEKHQAVTGPDEQQQKTLEWSAQQFNASSWARMRPLVIAAFVVLSLGGMIASGTIFNDRPLLAFGVIGGILGMAVMTFVFSFVLGGRRRRDVLYTKSRELVFGAGVVDWLVALAALGLLLFWLYSFGWLWWWAGAAVLAVAFAWAWQAIVDRGVQEDQAPMVARAERVLRELREAGVEEARVRRAVAEAPGRHWEAFYEAMFGYESKLDARRSYGVDDKGREKPRYAAWRDPILSWLNDRLEKRRLKRDQKFLKGLHKNELLAQGIKSDIAERAALNQARREIGQAALMREQIMEELRRELRREMVAEQRSKVQEKDRDKQDEAEEASEDRKFRRGKNIKYTDEDFERIHESYFRRRFGTPLDMLLGQQLRFAVAAVLILAFALWFSQNQEAIFGLDEPAGPSLAERQQERAVGEAAGAAEQQPIDATRWWTRIWSTHTPVQLLGIDPAYTGWISGFHVGLAGVLMMFGAFFYGRLLGLSTLLSAVLIVGVTWFLPAEFKWISILAGIGLWGVGVFFFRTEND